MATPCGATAKSTGKPCKQPVVAGTARCRYHGGAAPQVRAKGQLRLAEREARLAFGRLADVSTPIEDPLTALSTLAGHVTAWMEFMAGRIAKLEQLAYAGEAGEQVKGEIQLFERALDRCNTVLGTAARLKIDERLVRIDERKADLVIAAIDAALDAGEVPAERRGVAKAAAAKHLRLVA